MLAPSGEHSDVNCRLILDFPAPGGHNRPLTQFVRASLSSSCGFNEANIKVTGVSSVQDSRKTEIQFRISASSAAECWANAAKLRATVSDKSSPLNTIGNMKRVFNGAVLHVFDPRDQGETSPKNGVARSHPKVRYKAKANDDPGIRARPPNSASEKVPRRKSRPETSSTKLTLPDNSVHIPFEVVLVPSDVKVPTSPVRHVNVFLPPSPSKYRQSVAKGLHVDTRVIDQLLGRPNPKLPESLIKLRELIKPNR